MSEDAQGDPCGGDDRAHVQADGSNRRRNVFIWRVILLRGGFEGGGDHRPWGLEQRGEEVVEVETALPCGADDAGEDLLGLRATLRAIAVFPPVNDRISSACSSVATKPVVLPWRKWRHTAAARDGVPGQPFDPGNRRQTDPLDAQRDDTVERRSAMLEAVIGRAFRRRERLSAPDAPVATPFNTRRFARADRLRPARGARSAFLSAGRGGLSQLIRSPRFPVRFAA